MADIVMADIVIADIVMADIVIADIVIADIVIADIVMARGVTEPSTVAYRATFGCAEERPWPIGPWFGCVEVRLRIKSPSSTGLRQYPCLKSPMSMPWPGHRYLEEVSKVPI